MKKLLFVFFSLPAVSYAQVADSSQRLLKLEGAINFRDIGGYRTTDNKRVKWGKLYRSADISKLTDKDMGVLEARQILTVVDLRESDEIKKAPDRMLPRTDYVTCSVTEQVQDWTRQMQGLTTGDSLMMSFYSRTATFRKKYRPLFQKLLQLPDTSALVYHCSAGKDRTGIGTALLLYALGVPMETIMQDYLATNEYRKGENEHLIRQLSASMNIPEKVAGDMASAKEQYLRTTFESIGRRYGSVDRFLKKELGVGKKQRKQLQKKFTHA
jgi:protein-tyrosine phosphatase